MAGRDLETARRSSDRLQQKSSTTKSSLLASSGSGRSKLNDPYTYQWFRGIKRDPCDGCVCLGEFIPPGPQRFYGLALDPLPPECISLKHSGCHNVHDSEVQVSIIVGVVYL